MKELVFIKETLGYLVDRGLIVSSNSSRPYIY